MSEAESLRAELSAYDGRSPAVLSEISMRHRGQTHFLTELINLASDEAPAVSVAATWIIKARLEEGEILPRNDIQRLMRGLDCVTVWQAQLHICQSLRHIDVPKDLASILEHWLNGLLDAPRPFLRAWVLDALCQLNGKSAKTKALLERMAKDNAASVRARVRNLKREFSAG